MAKVRSRDRTFGLPGVLLVDARIGWRPSSSGELSLMVENLADRRVFESYPEVFTPSIPLRRMVVPKWTQRF